VKDPYAAKLPCAAPNFSTQNRIAFSDSEILGPVFAKYSLRVEYLSMDLGTYVDEPTITALQRLLPGVAFKPILTPLRWRSGLSLIPDEDFIVHVNLPAAPGAEYSFELYVRPEKQIHAKLINADLWGLYFWSMRFEEAAFNNSLEKLDAAFIETLELLISRETRIVQRRSFFRDSFRCEYKGASGWQRLYEACGLRMGGFGFKVPRIAGRERIYRSPALAPGDGLG
jgi:hypothetical protein